jgi:hypothetical protein
MAPDSISTEEKRQALERVIASRTFARSDQLRSFLRFVCDAEIEGRAHDLNEYVLGVSVLGRPADYSPSEDSCVRSRAYELRNKLKSYYLLEAPDDPIQIAIDKGAYVPRFERRERATQAEAGAAAQPEPAPKAANTDLGRSLLRLSAVAAAIAVLAVSVSYNVFHLAQEPRRAKAVRGLTPEMAALWKPFVESDAPLLISYEVRLAFYAPPTELVVRDYLVNRLADAATSKPLAAFQARTGARLEERLDYADVGAVPAAFLLGRLLGPLRPDVGLKPSGTLGWEDIWNSNIIFLGKPSLHPTVRYVLNQGADFVQGIDLIRNVHPRPGEAAEYLGSRTHGVGEKYALITVAPGPQPGRHIMILGGAHAELPWALTECVTNPVHVREIVSHVRLPSGECPPAFQVLVQVKFESYVPIQIRYVTHRVFQAPALGPAQPSS